MSSFFLRLAAVLCLGVLAACGSSRYSQEPEIPAVLDPNVRPRLANRGDAVSEMREAYPRQLRDAGVSGETLATFTVLADGTVSRASIRVGRASTDDFREPTRHVVSRLRFVSSERGRQSTVRATLRWMLPQPDIFVGFGL
jgi:outer membrane biosynthesis protein TonB